jgi:hypothetical protein
MSIRKKEEEEDKQNVLTFDNIFKKVIFFFSPRKQWTTFYFKICRLPSGLDERLSTPRINWSERGSISPPKYPGPFIIFTPFRVYRDFRDLRDCIKIFVSLIIPHCEMCVEREREDVRLPPMKIT